VPGLSRSSPSRYRSRVRRRKFLTLVGAAALPTAGRSVAQSIGPGEPTAVERTAMADQARAFMQQYAVPGLSVAIGRAGQLLYRDAFGWASRELEEAATPAHLFRIGSVSKTITATAIFSLIEDGRLKPGDKVFGPGAVLGNDYATSAPYATHVDEITLEQLLTHTSGGWPNDGTDPMFNSMRAAQWELIAASLGQPLRTPPGQAFLYSNFGFCVLGRVIEKVSGRPYADYVRERVLARCGIGDMAIAENTLAARRSGEVKYYGQNGEDPYWLNVTRLDSCGGWIASPTDLVQFGMNVGRILKRETVATMTAASPQNPLYAKGWAVDSAHTRWHGGSLPGSKAILVHRSSGFCWAAVANSRDKQSRKSFMQRDMLTLLRTMVAQVENWRV
jgi:CubicO group peptidase (beta-lactamase class C family)